MYSLLKIPKDQCLYIELQIDLFNKIVKPTLMHGCELWGYANNNVLQKVQLQFLSRILNVKSSTLNCIVYSKTGVKLLQIDIDTRMISFWSKLIQQVCYKKIVIVCDIMLIRFMYNYITHVSDFQWFKHIKNILVKCGMINVWEHHSTQFSKICHYV